MKRVLAACLEQTIHFQLRENLGHSDAVKAVQEDYEHYKKQLDVKRIKYRILEEKTLEDGSIVIKIKKQYNNHDCGSYLDE